MTELSNSDMHAMLSRLDKWLIPAGSPPKQKSEKEKMITDQLDGHSSAEAVAHLGKYGFVCKSSPILENCELPALIFGFTNRRFDGFAGGHWTIYWHVDENGFVRDATVSPMIASL